MTKKCAVCGKYDEIGGTSFHRLPKGQRGETWIEILKLDMKCLRKCIYVCSDHFSRANFYVNSRGHNCLKWLATPLSDQVSHNESGQEKSSLSVSRSISIVDHPMSDSSTDSVYRSTSSTLTASSTQTVHAEGTPNRVFGEGSSLVHPLQNQQLTCTIHSASPMSDSSTGSMSKSASSTMTAPSVQTVIGDQAEHKSNEKVSQHIQQYEFLPSSNEILSHEVHQDLSSSSTESDINDSSESLTSSETENVLTLAESETVIVEEKKEKKVTNSISSSDSDSFSSETLTASETENIEPKPKKTKRFLQPRYLGDFRRHLSPTSLENKWVLAKACIVKYNRQIKNLEEENLKIQTEIASQTKLLKYLKEYHKK